MNKLFTGILLLLVGLLYGEQSHANNPAKETSAQPTYFGSEYNAGILVVRIKPAFRNACTDNDVAVAKFRNALQAISFAKVYKKFPRSKQPVEPLNKFGRKPIDLSLIYQVEFSTVVRIEEAIRIVLASGIVEYAEPLYKHSMSFTPNDPSISSQYHITKINAYTAWDVWTGDTNVVIGIVDSGTDWDHPDLEPNIKYNYADPIDNIDNDNDGFIDNYRGWDVSENDNNPMVALSTHGAHVSGCADAVTNNGIGVASPGYNCKFLPIKSTHDASASTIDNGYDGIIYAADHGVNVINCSWGRTGLKSVFEQESIDYAIFDKDITVIAAAGNDGIEIDHYPASYDNVISVASTGSTDTKSGFSNYSSHVSVCAPGSNILATDYNNTYGAQSGTSMASPIAAGCAAMIKSRFPAMNALQVGAQLRSTADLIYSVGGNNAYFGKLGHGRVNLYKAVTDSVSPGVLLRTVSSTDNNDNVFIPGDTLSVVIHLENLLRPTTNLTCSLTTVNSEVSILQSNYTAGVIGTMDTASNYLQQYRVYIQPFAPLNTEITFRLKLTDGTWSDNFLFTIVVNVDYINVQVNNVATSITSKSLIGYNQEQQSQGLGFTYQGSPTILYDMGLMIGASGTQVSDNMRGDLNNDADFLPYINVSAQEPGSVSDFDVTGVFRDNGTTSANPLGLVITQHAYAWRNAPDNNYVMVQYYIKNNGSAILNGLYAGLFADWDIPAYANNKCATDISRKMGYIWSTDPGGLYGGIKLLSHTGGFNHYALDNTANNGGIEMTDGYSGLEKYASLSVMRTVAGTATASGNDVLSVVSSGSYSLAVGDSVEVAFALVAGQDLSAIQTAADAAQAMYDAKFVGIIHVGKGESNQLFQSYPNPADREIRIDFSITGSTFVDLVIYNSLGEMMTTVVAEKLSSGRYSVATDISALPAGNYFYRMVTAEYSKSLPFTVVH